MRIRTSLNFPGGFTLAEIVVVVALFAVIAVLSTGIFLANNRFYQNQSGEVSFIGATRQAADLINQYARPATNFVASYLYQGTTYTTGSQTVILQLPALDSNDQVIADSFDYVIISVNPNAPNQLQLFLDPGSGSSRLPRALLLTDKLSALNFTYDNSDLTQARKVDYEIDVQDTGRNPAHEQIFGSATLRNK